MLGVDFSEPELNSRMYEQRSCRSLRTGTRDLHPFSKWRHIKCDTSAVFYLYKIVAGSLNTEGKEPSKQQLGPSLLDPSPVPT
ncbi:unnamed protein product [Urochloa humidicola]